MWFDKVAAFFGLGPDIQTAGKELYTKYQSKLPRLAYNEVSVGIICYIAKSTMPSWGYDDFIAAFPYALHKPTVIKSFLVVGGKSRLWEETMEDQFNYTLNQIYERIRNGLYSRTIPENFDLRNLKSYTRKLLDLGNRYDLNSGKKSRPLITAVACLCAVFLKTKTPITRVRRKRLRSIKEEYYHRWNFDDFSNVIICSQTYIKNIYNSYYNLIHLCVEKLSWVQCSKLQESIFHLDDVLELFLPSEENQQPRMKLNSDQLYPISYTRSLVKSELLAQYVRDAKTHISQDTVPDDPWALTTCIYSLLLAGYDENDFLQWTPGCMRSMSNMLDFRSTYGSRRLEDRDMDYPLLTSDDMNDSEINIYLKHSVQG